LTVNAVFGVNVEQFFGNGGEAQPLLHHGRADEEPRGDFLLAESFVAHRLEGAKLVQRMHVLGLAASVFLMWRAL